MNEASLMKLALSLAEKGRGYVSPNPMVGAVIYKKGKVISASYHERAGESHAEAKAIEKAGNDAKDSTLFINLEPCVHWGKTPPCVDKIVNAKIKKVFISTPDQNPLVKGEGIERLKNEGIDVFVGLFKRESIELNEVFFKFITKKIPFITVKAAISVDGKMATSSGESKWIGNELSRNYAHLLRGEYDAIMVGIGTILKDNPLLTIRHKTWEDKKIVRIILDSNLRINPDFKIFSTLGRGKLIIFTKKFNEEKRIEIFKQNNVEIIGVNEKNGKLDLNEIFRKIAEKDITSVLIEGGSSLISSVMKERIADRLILFVSPRLIGGINAPSLFGNVGYKDLKEALSLKKVTSFSLNCDTVFIGYFN
ncbi:MAG: bifunctional diaminohydroxyphosphoribosylaminopyrimidine deaminase/5-amino-6-(5-phosphoribosylamino)uracil reductase RibD [Acidobacteriota bacterium]